MSAGEQLFVLVKNGVTDKRSILLSAKNDANGRVVVGSSLEIVHHPDLHIHLSDVLAVQLTRLEIEEHKTLEQIVVENPVDIEVLDSELIQYCLATNANLLPNPYGATPLAARTGAESHLGYSRIRGHH